MTFITSSVLGASVSSPTYLGLENSPVGLWNLDGVLTELVSGFDMTVESGTERYSDLLPGLRGFYFDGSTNLIHNTFQSTLAIAGAGTWMVIASRRTADPALTLMAHGASGSTEADNQLYLLRAQFTGTGTSLFSRNNVAINNIADSVDPMPVGVPFLLGITRSGSGAINMYMNGALIAAPTQTSSILPTGGGSGRFRIGTNTFGGAEWEGIIASAKIIASELSAVEILAEYDRSLGRTFA